MAEHLPSHLQQRADVELGAAWRRCEAALPEGWRMGSLVAQVGFNGRVASTVGWRATVYSGELLGTAKAEAQATTPAEALTRLAVLLESR